MDVTCCMKWCDNPGPFYRFKNSRGEIKWRCEYCAVEAYRVQQSRLPYSIIDQICDGHVRAKKSTSDIDARDHAFWRKQFITAAQEAIAAGRDWIEPPPQEDRKAIRGEL